MRKEKLMVNAEPKKKKAFLLGLFFLQIEINSSV